MLTITRKPDPLMLSGNQISVEVLATTPSGRLVVERGGTRARIISTQGQGLPVNTSLSLYWESPEFGSFQVAFHTDGPFPQAYEIPEYTGGDLGTYWALVARTIGENIDVAPWFQVYSERNVNGTYSVWAVARSTDPAWVVRFLGADDGSVFQAEDNVYPDTVDAYRVRCDVVVMGEEGYRVAASIGSSLDARSRAPFDIDEILRNAQLAELEYPAVPAFSTAAPFAPDRITDYYLRLSELSEDEGYLDRKYVKDLSVFLGGVSNVLNAVGNYFDGFASGGRWVNVRPDRRTIGVAEPVYLSSIRRAFDVEDYAPYLEVEEYDAEGIPTTRFVYEEDRIQASGRQVITWPVGVAALGIAEDTLYYRVKVVQDRPTDPSNPLGITPFQTYVVDRTEYESVRYLAYLNSFYTVEVLRCVGSIRHTIDIDIDSTEVVRDVEAGIVVPDRENWNTQVRDAYTFATGYKERLEIETVVNELHRSPRLYEITPTGYTPLLVKGVSFLLHATGQNLHAATIQCELALSDRNYSRLDDLLTIPPLDFWASPDGEAWLGANEEPWL